MVYQPSLLEVTLSVVNGSSLLTSLWWSGQVPDVDPSIVNLVFDYKDIVYSVLACLAITFVRDRLYKHVFMPAARSLDTPPDQEINVGEHLFKCSFYTLSWLVEAHLVLHRRPELFYEPPNLWLQWSVTNSVPLDIYGLYILQIGFYLHETYAMSLGIETKRKDNALMFWHHGVALTLLFMSLWTRHYLEGLLVLFCHDLNDIFLELWKLNNTLAKRANGKWFAFHDNTASAFFAIFVISWWFFRLTYYPKLVLWNSFHTTFVHFDIPDGLPPYMNIFAVTLLSLYVMNCYWFYLMLQGIYRLLTGEMKRVYDTRELNYEQENEEDKLHLAKIE